MRKKLVIAIDGPAGVGKSTVGCLVAKRLGYKFINTGEMYRALTWKALEEKADLEDGGALTALARRLRWGFETGPEGVIIRTTLDGKSVSKHIVDERVSRNTSAIAGVPGVRRHLRMLQRRLGRDGGIVMEGRDIATNVFPDAELKIYLDASIDERASRRTRQLRSQGHKVRLGDIRRAIVERDRHDLQRRINPLRQAADAVVIDSTALTLQGVAGRILRLVRKKGGY
ncbi:MAG: (d)CMP kinase [Elusimicrobiota bacterium]